MAIVNLTKTRDQKVGELLNIFKLPSVSSTGYQVKPGHEPIVGCSAVNITEATRLHAVNELRRWTRLG